MESFIYYILKSSICLSLVYGLYSVVLKNTTFFKLNRAYLSVGIIISLLLPLVKIEKTITLSNIANISEIQNINSSNLVTTNSNTFWIAIGLLFVVGALIRLGFIIGDIIKIYKLYSSSDIQIIDGNKYFINSTIESPFSFGSYIFIGKTFFSDTEKNIIIKHELIHIKQLHIVDLILGQIVLLLQWFNPLAWLYIKSQKQNLEFLTDESVIKNGISMGEYQATLLNTVLNYKVFTLTQSFNY